MFFFCFSSLLCAACSSHAFHLCPFRFFLCSVYKIFFNLICRGCDFSHLIIVSTLAHSGGSEEHSPRAKSRTINFFLLIAPRCCYYLLQMQILALGLRLLCCNLSLFCCFTCLLFRGCLLFHSCLFEIKGVRLLCLLVYIYTAYIFNCYLLISNNDCL